jgi:hypothetical protein
VLTLIREHRLFFVGATFAGLALRLFFFIYHPAVTNDSRLYDDVATNWLQHGIYGQTQGGHPELPILPTDTRLPGYPVFLALIFWLFGAGDFRAVLLTQILADLGTCFIIADLARRMISGRAARIAFVLAAACPFLANYASAELTETLEIFFTALSLDCAVMALSRMHDISAPPAAPPTAGRYRFWAAAGAAIAMCILLRPDGGIVLAAVVFYLTIATPKVAKLSVFRRALAIGIVLVFALAPLVPWTIRNFHIMHHFQPLAPRYANDADELIPRGFNRWVKTWMVDYVSVEEIYWNVSGDTIDPNKLPSRATNNPSERDATLGVIADYNETQDLTPDLDARFETLAEDRIRAHPIRFYLELPLLRVADMWLRPRTELLPADPRWWEFNDDRKNSAMAVGFGLLNLAYVGMALLALVFRRSAIRWGGLLIAFVLLRSVFLGTLENPEPRYTLECYPVVIVCAAAYLTNAKKQSRPSEFQI